MKAFHNNIYIYKMHVNICIDVNICVIKLESA